MQPSFEIGVLELDARNDAVAAAHDIASALGLPVEVADPSARLTSPEREINDADDLPPPDDDAEEIDDPDRRRAAGRSVGAGPLADRRRDQRADDSRWGSAGSASGRTNSVTTAPTASSPASTSSGAS